MARKLLSKRDITINLFLLDDGKGSLESTLLDPWHLIHLELRIDPRTRLIEEASSRMVIHPYPICKLVEDRAKALAGLKIEKGILKRVTSIVGSGEGCVHLRELTVETINFAATALAGVPAGFGLMDPEFNRKDPETKHHMSESVLRGTCKAYTLPYDRHPEALAAARNPGK